MKYFVDIKDIEPTQKVDINFNERSVFINFGEGRILILSHPEKDDLRNKLNRNELEMERAARLMRERRTLEEGHASEA